MSRIEPAAGRAAVDMHVHTIYSKDSLLRLDNLIAAVQQRGLTAVAITDHNRIDGALRLREKAPFPVIVGEEIMTPRARWIGLFLERVIPRRLSPEKTVLAIREQGGMSICLTQPTAPALRDVPAGISGSSPRWTPSSHQRPRLSQRRQPGRFGTGRAAPQAPGRRRDAHTTTRSAPPTSTSIL
jgi:hypothetical protein